MMCLSGYAAVLLLAACASTAPEPRPEPLHVLFIGNSLTSYNDLPRIVEAMGRARGVELDVHSVVRNNASVQDHWDEGTAVRMVESRRWDFVVFQHGPSASEEGRVALREAMALFAPKVRAAGGVSALYMVWPFASRPQDFDRVRETYALAAQDVSGLFLPAGEAWRAAWREDAGIQLYLPDGLHPTPAGSYAAALVIYAGITRTSPVGLPAELDVRGTRLAIAPGTAAVLQRGAAAALAAEAEPQSSTGPRTRADSAQAARTAWRAAMRAYRADSFAVARELGARARAAWPTQPAYVYGLAALSARTGDAAEAARWLAAYAELGAGADVTTDDDFAAVRGSAAVRAAAARVLANRSPAARSSVAFRIPGADVFPEGIACTAARDCYVTSIRHGKVIRVDRNGRASDLLTPGQDGLTGALAVALSRAGNELWVTSAAIPQWAAYAAADSARAAVHAFALPSGKLVRRLAFPAGSGRHQPGDVFVARNGEVFVSDSRQPFIYRVPAEGDTLEVFATDPLFRSLQGIAESVDGGRLYVADYSHGILAVDRATRAVRPVPSPDGATVLGVDGLIRHGDRLVGLQNGIAPPRVIGMRLSGDGARITAVELLDRHLPLADQPTIGAVVGNELFYVANSQWEHYDDAGRPKAGTQLREAVVLRLPLR
jgi:DNA-binding beta-propeller fold protein YncE